MLNNEKEVLSFLKDGKQPVPVISKFLGFDCMPTIRSMLIKGKIILIDGYCSIPKKNKYNNVKTKIGDKEYDSKKEAGRAGELLMLQKTGQIKNLQEQPKFLIVDSTKWEGKTLRSRYYIADFQYEENNCVVVEDVKSEITRKNPVYTLKKQLFLIKYPGYFFREI